MWNNDVRKAIQPWTVHLMKSFCPEPKQRNLKQCGNGWEKSLSMRGEKTWLQTVLPCFLLKNKQILKALSHTTDVVCVCLMCGEEVCRLQPWHQVPNDQTFRLTQITLLYDSLVRHVLRGLRENAKCYGPRHNFCWITNIPKCKAAGVAQPEHRRPYLRKNLHSEKRVFFFSLKEKD